MYDKLITIEKATRTKNSVGNVSHAWQHLKTKFAHISEFKGNMRSETLHQSADTDAVFTIRYDSDVDYNCRFVYRNQTYEIMHIAEMGRQERMKIECQHTQKGDKI
jgi:SPP1 family predicted phage head-tail adaptor